MAGNLRPKKLKVTPKVQEKLQKMVDILDQAGVEMPKIFDFIDHVIKCPAIWMLFRDFALACAKKGKKIGAMAIINRMRWEMEIEHDEDDFKINNNYAPYLARIFMALHPEHEGFFELRDLNN